MIDGKMLIIPSLIDTYAQIYTLVFSTNHALIPHALANSLTNSHVHQRAQYPWADMGCIWQAAVHRTTAAEVSCAQGNSSWSAVHGATAADVPGLVLTTQN